MTTNPYFEFLLGSGDFIKCSRQYVKKQKRKMLVFLIFTFYLTINGP